MKKFLVSIFAVFYLGIASGATVHFHYCMGELFSWSFSKPNGSKCQNCGMKKSDAKKCCKDKEQQIKIQTAKKAENTLQLTKLSPVTLSSELPVKSNVQLFTACVDQPVGKSPPRTGKEPVFVLNRNFRI